MTTSATEKPLVFVKNALAGKSEGLSNEECGRGHACSFCPEETRCGLDQPAHNKSLVERRLSGIRIILLVLANKGGVGKSTVSANLATALSARGFAVGLADADVHGPNAPRLFGLHNTRVKVAGNGITPPTYQLPESDATVAVGSLGFFLEENDTPVVWRDAYKHDYMHHMIGSFDWGALDFLIIDMPPGTGNELITLTDMLESYDVSAVLVSSADAVALQDTLKASRFCKERGLPVLGLVENFAGTTCPHCGGEIELFPPAPEIASFADAGIQTLARLPFAAEISNGAAAGHPAAGQPDSIVRDWMGRLVEECTNLLKESTRVEIARSLETFVEESELPEDPALLESLRQMVEAEQVRYAAIGKEKSK